MNAEKPVPCDKCGAIPVQSPSSFGGEEYRYDIYQVACTCGNHVTGRTSAEARSVWNEANGPKPQYLDPEPLGEPGKWSVYEFKEIRREPTPCGGFVPLYCLKRVAGPFDTPSAALRERSRIVDQERSIGGPYRVKPDGGAVYKLRAPKPEETL